MWSQIELKPISPAAFRAFLREIWGLNTLFKAIGQGGCREVDPIADTERPTLHPIRRWRCCCREVDPIADTESLYLGWTQVDLAKLQRSRSDRGY